MPLTPDLDVPASSQDSFHTAEQFQVHIDSSLFNDLTSVSSHSGVSETEEDFSISELTQHARTDT